MNFSLSGLFASSVSFSPMLRGGITLHGVSISRSFSGLIFTSSPFRLYSSSFSKFLSTVVCCSRDNGPSPGPHSDNYLFHINYASLVISDCQFVNCSSHDEEWIIDCMAFSILFIRSLVYDCISFIFKSGGVIRMNSPSINITRSCIFGIKALGPYIVDFNATNASLSLIRFSGLSLMNRMPSLFSVATDRYIRKNNNFTQSYAADKTGFFFESLIHTSISVFTLNEYSSNSIYSHFRQGIFMGDDIHFEYSSSNYINNSGRTYMFLVNHKCKISSCSFAKNSIRLVYLVAPYLDFVFEGNMVDSENEFGTSRSIDLSQFGKSSVPLRQIERVGSEFCAFRDDHSESYSVILWFLLGFGCASLLVVGALLIQIHKKKVGIANMSQTLLMESNIETNFG